MTHPSSGGGAPATARMPRPAKAAERVAAALLADITQRRLAPGTTLPPERQMLEQYGVARGTLREALRLLESRGVVTLRPGPGGGPVVRLPQPADFSVELLVALQCQHATMADVLATREILELSLARRAALLMDDASVQQMRTALEDALDDPADHDRFTVCLREANDILATSAGSTLLRLFIDAISVILEATLPDADYVADERARAVAVRLAVVDAIEKRDPDAAEGAMRAKLEESVTVWQRWYPQLLDLPVRWQC